MKTITQREFRNQSAAIMDSVERGESFRVTRRGVPVAEVRPVLGEPFTPISQIKQAFAILGAGDFEEMRREADEILGAERIDD